MWRMYSSWQVEEMVQRRTAELRQAEEKYRSIFENAVEGIFQTSVGGRILAANPALVRMLGYSSPTEIMREVTNIQKLYLEPICHAYSKYIYSY